MRSIKLKIVTWIIALFCIIGSCIAQDSTSVDIPPWGDSVNLSIGLDVQTDPVIFKVESESIEDNEVLQTMLGVATEQTEALNKYLLNLNEVIKTLPKYQLEVKQERLDIYNIEPNEINRQYKLIYSIWYIMLFLYITIWISATNTKKGKLYWSSKNKTKNFVILILGSFVIGWLLPNIYCLLFIDNYYLWSNLDKLF